LGWKAVASNVADIAAMGAVPTALVVALCAPGDTSIEWLEAFADGLREGCLALAPQAAVVGGDLARAEQVMIAVTAHGDLGGRAPVLRSGAHVGDVIAVGGTLGKAACGLALLESGNRDAIAAYDELVAVQLRPQPPVALGPAAAEAGATAMLDVSDGLSRDLTRIAAASKVSAQIDPAALQGFEAMLEQPAAAIGASPLDWVLHGGEDHSLLATFPADAALPRGFKPIGKMIAQNDQPVWLGGHPLPIQGWDSTL
jgi:thiamine-monophosphate kinase